MMKNWPDSLSGCKNFDNCVESTDMHGWFLVKVGLIAFDYSVVILGAFQSGFIWFWANLRNFNQRKITFFGHFFVLNDFPRSTKPVWLLSGLWGSWNCTFWGSWNCPSIKFSIEQKSYYFHLKEPNPLISELFLVSKSKQDKPFK